MHLNLILLPLFSVIFVRHVALSNRIISWSLSFTSLFAASNFNFLSTTKKLCVCFKIIVAIIYKAVSGSLKIIKIIAGKA